MYPEKIKAWLSRSMDALADVCDEEEEEGSQLNGEERIHSKNSDSNKSTTPTFLKMRQNKNKKNSNNKNTDNDNRTKQRCKQSSLSSEDEEHKQDDISSPCSSRNSSTTSSTHFKSSHRQQQNINDDEEESDINNSYTDHTTQLPSHLEEELEDTDFTVFENVPWDISKSDMFIEVDGTLFPTEKNFLVYISEKFQVLIYGSSSMQVANSVFLSLSNQYSIHEIQTVLSYMHSSDDAKLTGMFFLVFFLKKNFRDFFESLITDGMIFFDFVLNFLISR